MRGTYKYLFIYKISTNGNLYLTSGFSFSYDSTLTPIISAISPTHSTQGILTIQGSGFGTNISIINNINLIIK